MIPLLNRQSAVIVQDADGPEKLAIQNANLLDQRKKAIKEILVRWCYYLRDPTDRQSFYTKYSVEEGVDITDCVSEQYSLDSFRGVVTHVTDALKDRWVLTYYVKKAKYNANYAWSLSSFLMIPIRCLRPWRNTWEETPSGG